MYHRKGGNAMNQKDYKLAAEGELESANYYNAETQPFNKITHLLKALTYATLAIATPEEPPKQDNNYMRMPL